jgi:hypothetical protein
MTDPAPAIMLPVAIVQLLGQLGWPVAVLIIVFRFQNPIEKLLSRFATSLASFKFAGTEWVIQEPAVKPPTVTPKAAAPIPGPDGFLTVESLRELVSNSGLAHGEEVKKELLIFQTPSQRTWLLATNNFVFVLLDDERTRFSNSAIQTFFDKKKTFPLKFVSDKTEGAGIVIFREAYPGWYYSFQLFDTSSRLKEAVEKLVA